MGTAARLLGRWSKESGRLGASAQRAMGQRSRRRLLLAAMRAWQFVEECMAGIDLQWQRIVGRLSLHSRLLSLLSTPETDHTRRWPQQRAILEDRLRVCTAAATIQVPHCTHGGPGARDFSAAHAVQLRELSKEQMLVKWKSGLFRMHRRRDQKHTMVLWRIAVKGRGRALRIEGRSAHCLALCAQSITDLVIPQAAQAARDAAAQIANAESTRHSPSSLFSRPPTPALILMQTYENKEILFSSLCSAVPGLLRRDPWQEHMLCGWAVSRWRLQTIKLQSSRTILKTTKKYLYRAEFGEESKDRASVGSMSSLSPLRPPTGEIQLPPMYKRQLRLASAASPPDSSGSSIQSSPARSPLVSFGESVPRVAKELVRRKSTPKTDEPAPNLGFQAMFSDIQSIAKKWVL